MATERKSRYRWSFYRAGEVDQVVLATGDDLANLEQLDQKLWLALACPTRGLEFPSRTLDFLDTDKDRRIRVPEILQALRFVREVFRDLNDLFKGDGTLPIDAISEATQAGKDLRAGAKRILENLGKADAQAISLDDVADTAKIFAATRFNGDGIVPADAADNEATRLAIDDIVSTHGSLLDRSGKPGVHQALVDRFFDDAKTYVEWLAKGEGSASPRKLGAATDAAELAVRAVRAKLDDYFVRCRMAAFDERAAVLLNAPEGALAVLSPKDLSAEACEIAELPLARVEAGKALSLTLGVNPAWEAALATFVTAAVTPILGPGKAALSEADWTAIKSELAPFVAWLDAKPATKLEALGPARVRELLSGTARQAISDLIARDAALATESNQIDIVEKAILYRRDLVLLLKNFVNFAAFYGEGKAIFQTGTLYLDGRSCELCLPVEDATKHAALAGLAKAYLVYCDCTRLDGAKRGIVAAFTGGDTDNLLVGRNGVFYDRQGNDWDATITKIVENPISIRQAFWSPYKSFVRMIEAQVAKRAAAADQETRGKVESTAFAVAQADKTKDEAAAKKAEAKKIDVGTVAAIGVAVGGIATFLSSVLATFFGLGMWMPLGILALILAISGPSMLIAWLKLRQRNVGPILDANGWAVNALAKINVPFGSALTKVAALPFGSRRQLHDPFARKRRPYWLYLLFVLVLASGALWWLGKLDRHLPSWARMDTVLKRS
jgi:hypothetical protein